jgi:hypothetical protein
MTKRRHIDVTATTTANAAAVYELLADRTTWPRWSSIESVELDPTGEASPDGIGEIRVQRRGRTTGRDQVTELVRGRRYAYRALSGLPVRDYAGQVDLEPRPDGTGTTIRWRSSFFPKIPGTGWLLERGIGRFINECAQGLAQYAGDSERANS